MRIKMKQSQRLGKKKSEEERENVSDMKLSACVTAGQVSSHLLPCRADANGGKSPHLNVSLSVTSFSALSPPRHETPDGEGKCEAEGIWLINLSKLCIIIKTWLNCWCFMYIL